MYLTHLSLTHFRNYTRLELDLPARVHVIRGDNAQGKTNLLEAIYYLATTKSPLTSTDRELIQWQAHDEVIPHARARAVYVRQGEEHTIDATLVLERENGAERGAERGAQRGVAGPPTRYRRQIEVDGVPRRAMDVVGRLNAVLFMPQDIALVTGSPGNRRRHLDITLCQIDPVYCQSLSRYNRVLGQRNALLREGRPSEDQLAYWDAQLTRLGGLILERRLWAIGELDERARIAQHNLTGGGERLEIAYRCNLEEPLSDTAEGEALAEILAGPADAEGLAAWFGRALRAARGEERRRGVTVVGPHRDDIRFYLDGHDAIVYGSRGQQRTVALALKLAEVELMRGETGETPVLLLDDILSELDEGRGRHVLETVAGAQQVLMTSTDLRGFSGEFIEQAMLWTVVAGAVEASGEADDADDVAAPSA
jgi:DNA replication and repair protein RecF